MNTGAPSERVDRFPPPRDFQVSAHDALRFGFKEGHKNQLIMAPTGGARLTSVCVSFTRLCRREKEPRSCATVPL